MSETTPDPADVHTGTDRVELTEEEREALEDAINESLDTYANASFLIPAVGSIVAARVQALNERIAELEAIAERNGVRWCRCSRAARARDVANPLCPLHGEPMVKQRDALQATLDRVTAVLASVEAINDGGWQPMVENILTKIGTDLRAALTPEGKP